MNRTQSDLEVMADCYSEMLEERELEYAQSLEDAAAENAFNTWADEAVTRYPHDDRHRDTPRSTHIIKLDWPITRGGDAA
jgi:hypothetical protein